MDSIKYESSQERHLSIHLSTLKAIKEAKELGLMGLYMFYVETAKWQNTNQAKCNDQYVRQCLGCYGRDRLKSLKSKLVELGLVEYVQKRNSQGQMGDVFVRINYIANPVESNESPHDGSPEADLPSTGEPTTNACYNNKMLVNYNKCLKSNKKVCTCSEDRKNQLDQEFNNFQSFWDNYPKRKGKKTGKQITLIKFLNLSLQDQEQCILNANNYRLQCELSDEWSVDPVRFFKADMWQEWSETIEDPSEKRDHNGFSADSKSIIIPGFEDFGEFQIEGGNE